MVLGGDSGVLGLGLGLGLVASGVLLDGGVAVEPAAPLGDSLGAAELGGGELEGAGLVAEALAVPPVGAPDHQSCEARCLGEAFR